MPQYFAGLDLGQMNDYSALSIALRDDNDPAYKVMYCSRFPLGTTYPEVARLTQNILRTLPYSVSFAVDCTGVGRGVVDIFHEMGVDPIRITIVGNIAQPVYEGYEWRVSKRDLIGSLQVVIQQKRIRFAAGLDIATILDELSHYEVKISETGHDSYNARGPNKHDDMVLALACMVYPGERMRSDVPIEYAGGCGGTYDNRSPRRRFKTVWAQPDEPQQDGGLPGISPWG